MQPKLVVEFVGIPGAGKSRIAAALAQRLSNRFDVAFPDRFEYRRWQLPRSEEFRLDLRHAGSVGGYRIRRLWFDVRRSGFGFWVVGQSWRNSRYPVMLLEAIRRNPRQVYVLDEWLLHRAIEESIRRYDSTLAFSVSFSFPPRSALPIRYVCVDIDPAQALERIAAEDNAFRWFARDGDVRVIEDTLVRWQRHIDRLKVEMHRRNIACIEVDGAEPVESNAARLEAQLGQALATRAAQAREELR